MLFIVNPISGKGRNAAFAEKLKGLGFNVAVTERAGQAEQLAREAQDEVVVAVGGDGTVNEVARGLLGSGRTLGIIPSGSGDGLARHIGLPRRKDKAMKTIMTGCTRPLDVGLVDGRPFVSVCGVGFDAIVSERFAACGKRGLQNYVKQALLAWKEFKPETYRVLVDGAVAFEGPATLITVGNSDQWGNGVYITPNASCSDGILDVTVVHPIHTIEFAAIEPLLMHKHLDKSTRVECFKGERIEIHRENEGTAHFDGDNFSAGKMLDISIMKGALKVIVP